MSQEPAPEVQGVPVTALNWQDPPANRWAFWHVGDLLPTYRVPRGDGQVRPLPPAGGQPDLLAVPVTRMDRTGGPPATSTRSEEHTSELQSRRDLVCRLLL